MVSEQFEVPTTIDSALEADLSRINRLLKLIRDNPTQALTNTSMANSIGVSPRHLTRIVQKHCRTTPRNFATRTRIDIARKRLLESDDPIIDIAIELGFCDQSWFGTQFRKFTGISPKKYREQLTVGKIA